MHDGHGYARGQAGMGRAPRHAPPEQDLAADLSEAMRLSRDELDDEEERMLQAALRESLRAS